MARTNIYRHINGAGLSFGDRLKFAGIKTPNAGTIARSRSLSNAHHNLALSLEHYRNAVNRDFGRVGFGIALNLDG